MLRAILDGLGDDDWQWIKGWIEAHRRSCPWTTEDASHFARKLYREDLDGLDDHDWDWITKELSHC
jgi:hypothetical protein